MKSDNELKMQAINGTIWKLLEKLGVQMTQFGIQIVLARLLLPDVYGIVGLVTIFITVSDVFLQQGLTTALIQKKEADELDFSSVFYANMVVACILYGVLFVSAPIIAVFYNEMILVSVLRVLALNILIGAVGVVHSAIMARNLEFKKSFFRGLSNTITQGVIGIYFACQGYGVWALVFSKVVGTLVGTGVLCVTVKWHPHMCFSMQRIKKLFAFGSRVLETNLLNTIFNNIHSLIIGKYFTSTELGYYQRGQQIPQTFMTAIDGSINEVLYPTLSKVQDNLMQLKNALRRSIKTSVFVVMPLLMGTLATTENLVRILLTDKWLGCITFMQLTCIICAFWPLSARTNAINAIGRSDITLKVSLLSKGITIVMIVLCIRWGIYAIMLGTIGASVISFAITSYYTKRMLNYGYVELIADILPSIVLSLIMCTCVYAISFSCMNVFLELFIQVAVGVGIYIGGAILLKIDSLQYILVLIGNILKRAKGGK